MQSEEVKKSLNITSMHALAMLHGISKEAQHGATQTP